MFLKRCYDKEIMDDFTIGDKRIVQALNELKLVNKFLGGISTSKTGFRILLNGKLNGEVKVLDIGSGSSDIFVNKDVFPTKLQIISIDRNKAVCKEIGRSITALPIFGDVLNLPVAQNSVDIVHASLFLHHFDEDGLKKIIYTSLETSTIGVIINDLRRSIPALLGIKFLTALFSKSKMVKNDAPLSVKKGFIKSEIIELLNSLNIHNYKLKRKWAFRWLIVLPNQ